jgi:hypothetical protein
MLIAIDLETHPISEHDRLPRPVCMSVCADDGFEALVAGQEMLDVARALLCSRHTIVAYNGAAFDFPVLDDQSGLAMAVQHALKQMRLRCVMLWAQLADFAKGVNHSPNGEHYGDGQGYNLAAVTKRLWGATVAKGEDTWRLRYHELEGVPVSQYPDEAKRYVMNDARLALAIAKTLPEVPDVARKTRQFFWLAKSSARGAYTDLDRAREWRASLESDVAAYTPHLQTAGILRADGTRDLKIVQALIASSGGAMKLNPPSVTEVKKAAKEGRAPQGSISADKEACKLSPNPLVKLYSLYVDRQDKLVKEVKTVEQGLVHTSYRLAESGRTTSSHPPIQNIGVKSYGRKCFRARPGRRYVVTDYGMLELCCMAQLCNVMGCGDTLGKALRSGADVHTMLAKQIDPNADPKAIRRLAKEGNFGRNGGMGWKTLIATAHKREIELDEATAKRIIAAHRRQWPEIAGRGGYHDRVKAELERTGGVLEHYRSGRLRGGLSFTQGANTLFQGLGSEVNLDAFVMLSEENLMPVLSVHDEYHNEVDGDGEVKRIGEICETVSAEWLPFAPSKAEPKIVNDWSEVK